ncbi:hypothetical protein CKO11_11995 [Rhodobacter sp. TJ_12]|uniref:DUF2794 domain-containing protein n=1 Tax=Rhodobacter sp. TJ_12 TaxID=2029399 RepID=UPI001CBB582B|nr:DUF2794 domain-containing protein [Rhodobacter sp. TJ_12]MBZ4023178.1 hypothetical protein [Rhodobacter sp. TJ_12]
MTLQPPNPFPTPASAPAQVAFDRFELGAILTVYGRMVAMTEARDYAMNFARDHAVFAIFRRTAETPLYRIEKRPALRNKQGQYALIGAEGQMLKRGHELAPVLRVIERKLIRAVD